MRTIFLADAHLDRPHDREYQLLLEFLRGLEGNTATLFIMGDLFDFWLGFPSNPFRQYDAVLETLATLKKGGCRLVYFEGNHDFHLGPIFVNSLGVEVYRKPAIMTVEGIRLYLCHGDQINRRDYGYRMLRLLLHNRLTELLLHMVPASVAFSLRERLQRASRSGYGSKSLRWDYRELVRSFGRRVRDLGCDGLVTGHFHFPLCERLDDTPFMVLSLGAWTGQLHYGELIDGTLVQKTHTHTSEEG